MFPSNHDKYGLMDEFSWRNIQDLRFLQVNLKPLKKLELQFNCHAFWLANTHDYWYRSNGLSILRTRRLTDRTSGQSARPGVPVRNST